MSISERWSKVQIQTIRSPKKYSLVGGPFGSNLVCRDYQSEGVPVIRGGNLPDYSSFSFENLVFISEDKADSLLPNNAYPGDLIFTQRGTLGQVGLIPNKSPYKRFVISQSQMKLTVDEKKVDARFVYYYFRLSSTVQAIENYALSSGIPHINLDILRKFEIPLPPLKIQKKITSVISAYDRLIENNHRRIAILEKMAEEIYREWFVRMRFPGHEQVSFHKGIPQGWEVRKLEDFCERVTDGTHDTPTPTDEGYFLVTGKNLKNGTIDFTSAYKISEKDHIEISKRSGLNPWDIIFSNIGTLGSMAIVDDNFSYSVKNVLIFKPANIGQSLFLYYMLKGSYVLEQLLSYLSGASQQFIGLTVARNFKILDPGESVIEKFGEILAPFQQQKMLLVKSNQTLQQTRDRLLPRLISGKLSVEDLDI